MAKLNTSSTVSTKKKTTVKKKQTKNANKTNKSANKKVTVEINASRAMLQIIGKAFYQDNYKFPIEKSRLKVATGHRPIFRYSGVNPNGKDKKTGPIWHRAVIAFDIFRSEPEVRLYIGYYDSRKEMTDLDGDKFKPNWETHAKKYVTFTATASELKEILGVTNDAKWQYFLENITNQMTVGLWDLSSKRFEYGDYLYDIKIVQKKRYIAGVTTTVKDENGKTSKVASLVQQSSKYNPDTLGQYNDYLVGYGSKIGTSVYHFYEVAAMTKQDAYGVLDTIQAYDARPTLNGNWEKICIPNDGFLPDFREVTNDVKVQTIVDTLFETSRNTYYGRYYKDILKYKNVLKNKLGISGLEDSIYRVTDVKVSKKTKVKTDKNGKKSGGEPIEYKITAYVRNQAKIQSKKTIYIPAKYWTLNTVKKIRQALEKDINKIAKEELSKILNNYKDQKRALNEDIKMISMFIVKDLFVQPDYAKLDKALGYVKQNSTIEVDEEGDPVESLDIDPEIVEPEKEYVRMTMMHKYSAELNYYVPATSGVKETVVSTDKNTKKRVIKVNTADETRMIPRSIEQDEYYFAVRMGIYVLAEDEPPLETNFYKVETDMEYNPDVCYFQMVRDHSIVSGEQTADGYEEETQYYQYEYIESMSKDIFREKAKEGTLYTLVQLSRISQYYPVPKNAVYQSYYYETTKVTGDAFFKYSLLPTTATYDENTEYYTKDNNGTYTRAYVDAINDITKVYTYETKKYTYYQKINTEEDQASLANAIAAVKANKHLDTYMVYYQKLDEYNNYKELSSEKDAYNVPLGSTIYTGLFTSTDGTMANGVPVKDYIEHDINNMVIDKNLTYYIKVVDKKSATTEYKIIPDIDLFIRDDHDDYRRWKTLLATGLYTRQVNNTFYTGNGELRDVQDGVAEYRTKKDAEYYIYDSNQEAYVYFPGVNANNFKDLVRKVGLYTTFEISVDDQYIDPRKLYLVPRGAEFDPEPEYYLKVSDFDGDGKEDDRASYISVVDITEAVFLRYVEAQFLYSDKEFKVNNYRKVSAGEEFYEKGKYFYKVTNKIYDDVLGTYKYVTEYVEVDITDEDTFLQYVLTGNLYTTDQELTGKYLCDAGLEYDANVNYYTKTELASLESEQYAMIHKLSVDGNIIEFDQISLFDKSIDEDTLNDWIKQGLVYRPLVDNPEKNTDFKAITLQDGKLQVTHYRRLTIEEREKLFEKLARLGNVYSSKRLKTLQYYKATEDSIYAYDTDYFIYDDETEQYNRIPPIDIHDTDANGNVITEGRIGESNFYEWVAATDVYTRKQLKIKKVKDILYQVPYTALGYLETDKNGKVIKYYILDANGNPTTNITNQVNEATWTNWIRLGIYSTYKFDSITLYPVNSDSLYGNWIDGTEKNELKFYIKPDQFDDPCEVSGIEYENYLAYVPIGLYCTRKMGTIPFTKVMPYYSYDTDANYFIETIEVDSNGNEQSIYRAITISSESDFSLYQSLGVLYTNKEQIEIRVYYQVPKQSTYIANAKYYVLNENFSKDPEDDDSRVYYVKLSSGNYVSLKEYRQTHPNTKIANYYYKENDSDEYILYTPENAAYVRFYVDADTFAQYNQIYELYSDTEHTAIQYWKLNMYDIYNPSTTYYMKYDNIYQRANFDSNMSNSQWKSWLAVGVYVTEKPTYEQDSPEINYYLLTEDNGFDDSATYYRQVDGNYYEVSIPNEEVFLANISAGGLYSNKRTIKSSSSVYVQVINSLMIRYNPDATYYFKSKKVTYTKVTDDISTAQAFSAYRASHSNFYYFKSNGTGDDMTGEYIKVSDTDTYVPTYYYALRNEEDQYIPIYDTITEENYNSYYSMIGIYVRKSYGVDSKSEQKPVEDNHTYYDIYQDSVYPGHPLNIYNLKWKDNKYQYLVYKENVSDSVFEDEIVNTITPLFTQDIELSRSSKVSTSQSNTRDGAVYDETNMKWYYITYSDSQYNKPKPNPLYDEDGKEITVNGSVVYENDNCALEYYVSNDGTWSKIYLDKQQFEVLRGRGTLYSSKRLERHPDAYYKVTLGLYEKYIKKNNDYYEYALYRYDSSASYYLYSNNTYSQIVGMDEELFYIYRDDLKITFYSNKEMKQKYRFFLVTKDMEYNSSIDYYRAKEGASTEDFPYDYIKQEVTISNYNGFVNTKNLYTIIPLESKPNPQYKLEPPTLYNSNAKYYYKEGSNYIEIDADDLQENFNEYLINIYPNNMYSDTYHARVVTYYKVEKGCTYLAQTTKNDAYGQPQTIQIQYYREPTDDEKEVDPNIEKINITTEVSNRKEYFADFITTGLYTAEVRLTPVPSYEVKEYYTYDSSAKYYITKNTNGIVSYVRIEINDEDEFKAYRNQGGLMTDKQQILSQKFYSVTSDCLYDSGAYYYIKNPDWKEEYKNSDDPEEKAIPEYVMTYLITDAKTFAYYVQRLSLYSTVAPQKAKVITYVVEEWYEYDSTATYYVMDGDRLTEWTIENESDFNSAKSESYGTFRTTKAQSKPITWYKINKNSSYKAADEPYCYYDSNYVLKENENDQVRYRVMPVTKDNFDKYRKIGIWSKNPQTPEDEPTWYRMVNMETYQDTYDSSAQYYLKQGDTYIRIEIDNMTSFNDYYALEDVSGNRILYIGQFGTPPTSN